MYGNGAVIGWTAEQVGSHSLWQFNMALAGFANANSPDEDGKLSKADEDALWEMVQAKANR